MSGGRIDVLIGPPTTSAAAHPTVVVGVVSAPSPSVVTSGAAHPSVVAGSVSMPTPTVSVGGMAGGDVTHGIDLTINHVGPWTLQGVSKTSETLNTLNGTQLGERYSTFPGNSRPSYISGSNYVYDNSTSNHGGIVPTGGMVIDGWSVPAGVWVVQFQDMSASDVIIEGFCSGAGSAFPGVFFRGCRMRGTWGAPGWFNQNGQQVGGPIWISYCDSGGSSTVTMNESVFESKGMGGNDKLYVRRCYLSLATTLVFLRNSGDAAIENFCEKVTDFGDASKHLNGIGNSGGQTATAWVRNNMVMVQQAGSTQLTDVIQFAADDGAYPGTGTNYDGSTGYIIKDNYLGGAAYVFQLGVDKANTAADVKNIKVNGNKITTSLYSNGGSSGLGYKGPTWGSLGNDWGGTTPNTWADGVNAGNTIPSSAIAAGP